MLSANIAIVTIRKRLSILFLICINVKYFHAFNLFFLYVCLFVAFIFLLENFNHFCSLCFQLWPKSRKQTVSFSASGFNWKAEIGDSEGSDFYESTFIFNLFFKDFSFRRYLFIKKWGCDSKTDKNESFIIIPRDHGSFYNLWIKRPDHVGNRTP